MTPIKSMFAKVNAWRRYRDAVRELSGLSNRELHDIGIDRADIEHVAREAAAG